MQKGFFLRITVVTVVFLLITMNCYRAFTSASGPGGGYSGAPGESNCTSCHFGGGLTTSSSVISITFNGSTTLKYKADSTYTVVVTVAKSGINKWGFLTTALKDSNNTFIGTFTAGTNNQLTSTTISGKTRRYVEHTSSSNTGTGGRSWTFTWKAPSTNVGTITFYVAANAADGNGVESGDAIHTNKFTLSFVASTVPVAGFTYSPTNPCEGDTVTFSDASTRTPTSWAWTFPGGTPSSSTLQNPKVVFTWGGKKVSLTATNKDGSSSPYSKAINITQRPSDTLYRSGPTTFCGGDSVLLTADFVGQTFKWSTGQTDQAVHFYNSGSYYCTVTNGGCTTQSQVVTVKVLPRPTLTVSRLSNNDTLCLGDSVAFTISTSAKTHNFYNNGVLIPKTTGNTVKIGGLKGVSNKIYAIAFDSLGCPSDSSKNFREIIRTRLAAPALSAGTPTTQSVTVNWNAVTGAKGYQVSADSGKTWKTPSGTLTHTESGLPSNTFIALWVRAVQDASFCGMGNIAVKALSSLPCSQTTYTLKADSMICPGANAVITFSKISAVHYSIILNGVAKKDSVYTFAPAADTVLQFAMFDSLKSVCGSFAINIPVKIIQVKPASISSDRPFYCGMDGAIVKPDANYDEYDYYFNGKIIQNDTTRAYKNNYFSDGDVVFLRGKTSGCISDPSNKLVLHRYQAPVAGFTYNVGLNRAVKFTNTTLTKDHRTWYFGDGGTDTSFSPSHTYLTNNTYTVSLVSTGPEGCSDSVDKTLFVSGIIYPIEPQSINIMPNPFNNLIKISFFGNNFAYLHVIIADVQGRTVKEVKAVEISKGNNIIDIPVGDLIPGTYILKMDDGRQILSRPLIKN
jgi:PKD repeat protein